MADNKQNSLVHRISNAEDADLNENVTDTMILFLTSIYCVLIYVNAYTVTKKADNDTLLLVHVVSTKLLLFWDFHLSTIYVDILI